MVTLTYPNSGSPVSTNFTFQGNATDAGTIATKLNAMFLGLGYAGNPVTVTQTSSGFGTAAAFAIAFGGTMAGISVQPLSAAATGGASALTATLAAGGAPNITTVNQNTQLVVNTPGGTVNNPLTVYGAGTDNFSGVLQMTVAGTAILAGNILLHSNATFGDARHRGHPRQHRHDQRFQFDAGLHAQQRRPRHVDAGPAGADRRGQQFSRGQHLPRQYEHQQRHSGNRPSRFAAQAPGGLARTFVNTNINESGTLAFDFTNNPAIPLQDVVYAQVQTLTFTGAAPGLTNFTLNYNGVATAAIAYTWSTAADAADIQAALNGLSTIGGIGASVSVALAGATLDITFGGSLGGMEIPILGATITSGFGSGSVNVGTTSGATAIGFNVPDEYLTLAGSGTAIVPGAVLGAAISAGGVGYTSAPTVTFTGGGGTGASGIAVITAGVVTGVTITSAGVGYRRVAPTITFTGGGGAGAAAIQYPERHRAP